MISTPSRQAPIELVIETLGASGKPHKLVLSPGQVRQVGRGARADLSIPEDTFLSDAHFSVSCDASGGAIRDLRSRNGLLVNGQQASEKRLADGDQVTAGKTVFTVRVRAVERAPVATPVAGQAPVRRPAAHERPYDEARSDPDPRVRREALRAAALTRQPWLLEHLRAAARDATPEKSGELRLLATLAESSDLPRLLALGRDETLGPLRFEILGALGHPDGIPVVIAALDSEDPALASAASHAFTKLTGVDVDTGGRFESSGPDADVALDVAKPSAAKAAEHWRCVERELRKSERLQRGRRFDPSSEPRDLAELDLESAAELVTRAAHHAGRRGARIDA